MTNDKKTFVEVHRLPHVGMQAFHKQYGLWITRCATGTTPPDFFDLCPLRYFEFYSLSHMYDGKGRLFLENNKTTEIAPGDCVIITPGTRNRYGSVDGYCYSEDVVNFTGPVADMLMESGVISNGVFSLGHTRQLLTIQKYAADPAVDSQLRANIELQKLLVELHLKKNNRDKPEYPLLEELLDQLRKHPEKWWNVREMAEFCELSTDHFRRIFFQRTGVKPKIYVERLKINRAADFLSGAGTSIAETAEKYGYQDPYHFARRFKMVMGVSPGQYRDSFAAFYRMEKAGNDESMQERSLVLKTARLTLSPMKVDELQKMIAEQKIPEFKQAFSEMLEGSEKDPEHGIWYVPWKVMRNHETIGELGFKGPEKNGYVEIGYGMHPGFEGYGYMTEAVDKVVRWALKQSGIHTVYAEADAENKASLKILENLGFTRCGSGQEGPRFQKTS